jgi:hypothetical protein
MKRFTVCLLVAALLSMGIVPQLMAAERPKALAGVDISAGQQITDQEAQKVKGEGFFTFTHWGDFSLSKDDIKYILFGPNYKKILKKAKKA